MKIAKCTVNNKFIENETMYFPLDAISKVHKNGKMLADLFGITILGVSEKTIAYEESTARQLNAIADDYCIASIRAINKGLYGACRCLSLTDVQMCTPAQLERVRAENDRELNHLCRKVGTWNGKASDVYISALAKQA